VTPAEVTAFTPLVKACARRFTPSSLPASIDADDLESVAWQALIEAQATHDPARCPFDAWAWLKMRGAVLDEIRRHRFGKRAGERGDVTEPGEFDGEREGKAFDSDDPETEMALSRLPKQHRVVAALLVEGLSVAQIAERQGVSRPTAAKYVDALRGQLRSVGFAPEEGIAA
jgi:RNA polymerase sigma factor (sigma-70 family)